MTDDLSITQPQTLGEVNLSIRFMQKAIDKQGETMALALKEINAKLDEMTKSFTPLVDFAYFRNHVEKDFALKEEYLQAKDQSEKERRQIKEDIKGIQESSEKLFHNAATRLEGIEKRISDIAVIRMIAYGFIGLLLTTIVGAGLVAYLAYLHK